MALRDDWLINERKGVHYLTEPKQDFEALYVEVRDKEDRLHSDKIVKQLPAMPKGHPHHSEWEKRAWTSQKFSKYLSLRKPINLLEIGCGNGWFANAISKHCEDTFALDIGKEELEQAARCFAGDGIHFICCTDWSLLPKAYFDMIVFNASIQYFDLNETFWRSLYRLLRPNGEIHILDSPFYERQALEKAKQRTEDYFKQLQVAEASDYYRHACWEDLPPQSKKQYQPNRWLSRLTPKRSPFPWITVSGLANV